MIKEKTWGLKMTQTTWWCRKFGHKWHNDYSRNTQIIHGEPCIRNGCNAIRSTVPDDFEIPDMSTPVSVLNTGPSDLQELEKKMWTLGNDLRAKAKSTTKVEDWARYDGLEQAKAIVLTMMYTRGEKPI